jgi:hypothetical protein
MFKILGNKNNIGLGRYKRVFNDTQEKQLADHIIFLESRLFGLSARELRELAYNFAVQNHLPHNFNKDLKVAGLQWLKGFFKRHENLSLRKPEPTSVARAMGFNRVVVGNFFDLLTNLIDTYKFTPNNIYNVDETAVTTVQKSMKKIVALRGRRQVGKITSAERGQLMTLEICMSAAGNYIPPLLVFPRKREKLSLMDGTPPGSKFACHPSGWMQTEIFIDWFKHFLSYSNPSEDHPVLLLLDGHSTHVKNIEVIELARRSHVHILCFPPHCTHKLQPLDVTFNKPLSDWYSHEVNVWMRQHPGRAVTQHDVGRLFGKAYLKACSMETAINGFRKTGIYPLNRGIFTDADFMPSATTDNYEETENLRIEHETQGQDPSSKEQTLPRGVVVSPEEIMPIPKAAPRQNKPSRRRGKTAVITKSPYLNDLKASTPKSLKPSQHTVKRNLVASLGTDQEVEAIPGPSNRSKNCVKRKKKISTSEEEDDDDHETSCIICKDVYVNSKSGEGWIQCDSCTEWAHEACALLRDDDEYYLCDFCT